MKAWHPFFMPRPHSAMCDALGGVYRAVRCDERCGGGEGRNEPAPRPPGVGRISDAQGKVATNMSRRISSLTL